MNLPAEREESAVTVHPPVNANPFAITRPRDESISSGTVAIEESRAIAEAQGKLIIAKKFPRNQAVAWDAVMASCRRARFADAALYSFPRGNETVEGASIRLAEELARAWGNIDFGIRELSQKEGVSEMEAYAWDTETNVFSSQKFQVRHIRDTRNGPKRLTDSRDIYELTANMAARRLRARILAVLPPDLVEAAQDECNATLIRLAESDTAKKAAEVVKAFAKLGVTSLMLADRLGHSVEEIKPEELVKLRTIHKSISEHMTGVSDWFDIQSAPTPKLDKLNAQVLGQPTPPPASEASQGQPPASPPAPAAESKPAATEQTKSTNDASRIF